MTGWGIGIGLALGVLTGWTFASWYAAIRNEEAIVHWTRRALVAEHNTDHKKCHEFIAHQEELLDTYRAGKTTGEQAEAWLSEQDGAS